MASANRAMRRRQAKAEQKMAQLFKNGITQEDWIKRTRRDTAPGIRTRHGRVSAPITELRCWH